jgi:hypothetical protein
VLVEQALQQLVCTECTSNTETVPSRGKVNIGRDGKCRCSNANAINDAEPMTKASSKYSEGADAWARLLASF